MVLRVIILGFVISSCATPRTEGSGGESKGVEEDGAAAEDAATRERGGADGSTPDPAAGGASGSGGAISTSTGGGSPVEAGTPPRDADSWGDAACEFYEPFQCANGKVDAIVAPCDETWHWVYAYTCEQGCRIDLAHAYTQGFADPRQMCEEARLEEQACAAAACGPVAKLDFLLSESYAELRASTLEVCRNVGCATVSLSSLPAQTPAAGEGVSLAPIDVTVAGKSDRVELALTSDGMRYTIGAGWFPGDEPADLADGDVYTVSVTLDGGRELVLSRRAVTYEARWVNATGCEPRCQTAQFAGTGEQCCPRDVVVDGTMYLGGAASGGQCFPTYDFFCTDNWRVEEDAEGCEVWQYDQTACPDAGP